MDTHKKGAAPTRKTVETSLVDRFSKECWTYIKNVVNIVREPILILDKDLRVMVANEPFYRMFQVERKDTEGTVVYELGNGQWNIPALRKLLEDILPKNSFFMDFEVNHEFPFIGRKSMILNARQIHSTENGDQRMLPPIIFLAIEDVTSMMAVAETLAVHVKELAAKNADRTQRLEMHIQGLEKEINTLQRRP